MKRRFSAGSFLLVAVAGGFGSVVFLSYLVPGMEAIQRPLIDWAVIVGTVALIFLGGLNVLPFIGPRCGTFSLAGCTVFLSGWALA